MRVYRTDVEIPGNIYCRHTHRFEIGCETVGVMNRILNIDNTIEQCGSRVEAVKRQMSVLLAGRVGEISWSSTRLPTSLGNYR